MGPDLRYPGGTPAEIAQGCAKPSPIVPADPWQTPMPVLHGGVYGWTQAPPGTGGGDGR